MIVQACFDYSRAYIRCKQLSSVFLTSRNISWDSSQICLCQTHSLIDKEKKSREIRKSRIRGSSNFTTLCNNAYLNNKIILYARCPFSTSYHSRSLMKKSPKESFKNLTYNCYNWLGEVAPPAKKYFDFVTAGARSTWSDLKVYFKVRRKQENLDNDVTYREEMILYSVNRDLVKVTPLFLISMVPFGFLLLLIPITLFPRYVLPMTFWSDSQRNNFLQRIHLDRSHYYGVIINHMNYHKMNDHDEETCHVLDELCSLIATGNVPTNYQLYNFRQVCKRSYGPFDLDNMVNALLTAFCKTIMISPYKSSTWICYRLRKYSNMILSLDEKIRNYSLLNKLQPKDIEIATLMRGLDSANLSYEANVYWLRNWLKLTNMCDESEVWFVLHAMVILSTNYNEVKYQRRVFG